MFCYEISIFEYIEDFTFSNRRDNLSDIYLDQFVGRIFSHEFPV